MIIQKNGWFDKTYFEDWIKTITQFRKIEETKILLGGNFSSYISLEVIRFCELHDIKFLSLSSNSTFFATTIAMYVPLTRYWHEALSEKNEKE